MQQVLMRTATCCLITVLGLSACNSCSSTEVPHSAQVDLPFSQKDLDRISALIESNHNIVRASLDKIEVVNAEGTHSNRAIAEVSVLEVLRGREDTVKLRLSIGASDAYEFSFVTKDQEYLIFYTPIREGTSYRNVKSGSTFSSSWNGSTRISRFFGSSPNRISLIKDRLDIQ